MLFLALVWYSKSSYIYFNEYILELYKARIYLNSFRKLKVGKKRQCLVEEINLRGVFLPKQLLYVVYRLQKGY